MQSEELFAYYTYNGDKSGEYFGIASCRCNVQEVSLADCPAENIFWGGVIKEVVVLICLGR